LHQENVVENDVDRVGCVSFGRSINLKVQILMFSPIPQKVEFDFEASVDGNATVIVHCGALLP